ncbi:MAG TPA: hypothetical protein VMS64_21725 [Candidatus Methylomirabilis sp.]|nr:hypothetical protein [Candidatus Methylomirabilis sp.]
MRTRVFFAGLMFDRGLRTWVTVVALCGLSSSGASAQTQAPLTPAEAKAIAEEAYVFGMAIVEHYKPLCAYGVDPKSPKYAGIHELRHDTRLYGPKDTPSSRPTTTPSTPVP